MRNITFNIEDENGTYTIREKNISFIYVSKVGRNSYLVTNSGVQIDLTAYAAKTIVDAIKGE